MQLKKIFKIHTCERQTPPSKSEGNSQKHVSHPWKNNGSEALRKLK